MTKKDYRVIAAIIDSLTTARHLRADAARVATWFADELQRDNPRFDRERFLAAAGVRASAKTRKH